MSLTGAASVPLGVVDAPGETEIPRVADAAVFECIFDACASSFYRYFAVRAGDAHLADDLMQQLWLQARVKAAGIPPANLEYWLRAIARNLLLTHWRVKARRPGHQPMPDPDLAASLADRLVSEAIDAHELERREIRDQLLLAITELPAAEQELIIGCYFDDVPHAELAARLGISERAVEGRLYRARAALRERLRNLDG
jgi:RNA polymerase sigma factor (sigma-70 family)